MAGGRMHSDEVDTDEALVRRLLGAQFPEWAGLSIERIGSTGTDNAIYRLGDDMAVRLPRIGWAVGQVEKEHLWLPRLAPHLSLAIPEPLAMGSPGEGYPWHWSVYRWLEGENASTGWIADWDQAAMDVARFILELEQIDSAGAPLAGRGVPLAGRDGDVRTAIAAMRGMIDEEAVTAAWEEALPAPEWERAPVWVHGDMLPGNVLVEGGRVRAVIDFGGLGVGDPACDLMIGWALFRGKSRDVFRAALGVDDATWARGRGQALSQALIFIPYYLKSNPVGVRNAQRTIVEILAEQAEGT